MRKSTLILWWSFLSLGLYLIGNLSSGFAQAEYRISGKVIDDKGKEILNVKVSVNDGAFLKPIQSKGFYIWLKKGEKPEKVKIQSSRNLKDWKYFDDKKELIIYLNPPTTHLKGKVYSHENKALHHTKVHVAGVQKAVFTDASGSFSLELPPKLTINANSTITVNDSIVIPPSNLTVRDAGTYVIIKVPKVEPTEPEVILINQITHQVRLWDDTQKPIPYVKVAVDGSEYTTDKTGHFELILDEDKQLRDSEFFILGYEILKLNFENKGDYSIKVRKIEEAEQIDEEGEQIDNIFRADFNKIINELELEKQLLSQKGAKIRLEIEGITKKLNAKQVSDNQKNMLQSDLQRLIEALVATDVAYEEAQAKTKEVVSEMERVIMQKDSLTGLVQETIKDLEEEREIRRFELAMLIILALISIIGYLTLRKIQREKKIVEESRARFEQINVIGQKISATLNPDTLVQTVHENVNQLLDASVFGVGIYDKAEQKIIFKNFIDGGAMIPYLEEDMNDERKFSVWCIENRKEVVINDLSTEYNKYLTIPEYNVQPDWPQALIYLPLITEDETIGVITVQSFKKHAYEGFDTTLLETLASFVTIALKNSQAYREIEDKNKNITASIRYAKTIQQAILPSDKELQESLHEYFTIYKPKDIVSGDFYWFVHKPDQNRKFLAAVDCTGHGVPGAFMSMIGHSLLDEIVNADQIYEPARILENLNIRVREALKQDEKVNDDGMDVCLCMMESIDNNAVKVTFTGAKRPLYYMTQTSEKLVALKGDLKSVGGLSLRQRHFTNKEILLRKGDTIYLTSDGLIDQSGINKRKFGTLRLIKLLEENAHLPMQKQKAVLEEELQKHQQNTEQRDDIMVIGVRV